VPRQVRVAEMRKAWLGPWLAPVLILVGLVLQLTVLNGLRLPGGGVPDLVLVLVAVLAMTEGPVPGMIIGFAAGLCLDLAPPASSLIGQYALVFCLAGWAAGRLSGFAGRSAMRAVVSVALVVAAAEALAAGLSLLLEHAQVPTAEVRRVLPVSILYDLVLCPFVLYLVALASALLADGVAGGVRQGLLVGALLPKRAAKPKYKQRQPRLAEAAARAGDGWLGGGPGRHPGAGQRASTKAASRLRPANGVAGSASGLARRPSRPATTAAQFKVAGRRRGDGAIGSAVGSGLGRNWQPSRHPGLLAGAGREFRPQHGELGGSAARMRPAVRKPSRRGRAAIKFGAHRGDASVGRSLGSSWLATPSRAPVPRLRLAGSQSPVLGQPSSGLTSLRGQSATGSAGVPRLRMGASRMAATQGRPAAVVPRLDFRVSKPARSRRNPAVPKFRRQSRVGTSTVASGLVSGGTLDQSTFRAVRRRTGTPRLRLAQGRRSTGTLGTGTFAARPGTALRRRPLGLGKQPRFGYGRRSLLSRLAASRVGGRWLGRTQAGRRSGVYLLGRRSGGQTGGLE
jgi:rod shape-determining protein MreD